VFPRERDGIPIPKAITTDWIKNDPEPYQGLEAYLLSLICDAKWAKTIKAVLDELPPGYRLILRLCHFYSDVNNGGFVQFLGNKAGDDGAEIVETVEMLRRFHLYEIANMLRKAIALLGADLPPQALSTLSNTERERVANRSLSDEELSRRMRPLDKRFHRMLDDEYISKANEYIKAHPEEFVHEKLSIEKKPPRRRRR
jgi:hypothetical protein